MNTKKSEPLLKVDTLRAGYDRTTILDGISLEVCAGEIVVVVGPNGAGKTTLLNALSGLATIHGGKLELGGRSLAGLRPDQIVARGLAHCPEGRRILTRLTVEENLLAGNIDRKRSFAQKRDEVYDMFPILAERRHGSAQRLSGGQQQMLAIGRSLMSEPDIVLLDEPSLGLAPKLIGQIFQTVLQLANRGIAILLVEQNVRLALEVGDYAYLFESGRCRMEGGCRRIAGDPGLANIYLGAATHMEMPA